METLNNKIIRLGLQNEEISDFRRESLEIACDMDVSDVVFKTLVDAIRVRRATTIILPPLHLESLSRGRGWARQGRGSNAVWGERVDGGYEVGPGRWTVGATDGFKRKKSETWNVRHIQVGTDTWTIAN